MSSGGEIVLLAPAAAGAAVVAAAAITAAAGYAAFKVADGAATLLGSAADTAVERWQAGVQARSRHERALAEYQALAARVSAERAEHGAGISAAPAPPAPTGGSPSGLDAATAALGQLAAALERQLRHDLAQVRTAQVLAGIATDLAGARSASETAPRPAPRPSEDLVDKVRVVFDRLDSAVGQAVWDQIREQAAAVLTSRPGRADMALDSLRFAVQKATDDLEARRRRLAGLHERLDLYVGEPIDAARRRLFAAADDPSPDFPALEAAVERAVAQTVARATEQFVSAALRESLQEIGCEVEEGLETLVVEKKGLVHVRGPEMGDFAVRFRPGQQDGALRFNVVTPGEDDLDAETEQAWCDTLDDLLPLLEAVGIVVEVRERSEVGERPAQKIAPERFPFPRGAKPRGDRRADRRYDDAPRERQVGP